MQLFINALQTQTGVNMGDHAQDVTKAVIVTPEMTVQELCEQYLTKHLWGNEPSPDPEKFLVLRVAAPQQEV